MAQLCHYVINLAELEQDCDAYIAAEEIRRKKYGKRLMADGVGIDMSELE